MATVLWPLAADRVTFGTVAVVAAYGPCLGGVIVNPSGAFDQGLSIVEPIYVDLYTTALLVETDTCFVIQPGQHFTIPYGFEGKVSVNAASSGHAFSGYVIQADEPFVPLEGIGDTNTTFPPTAPTVLRAALPSYLYQQYSDDDDLQAFVDAFNSMVAQYIKWFALYNPADYTQAHIQGDVLDWIAAGLYGMVRGALPTGQFRTIGPLNTYPFNTWQLNQYRVIPPADYQVTSDDTFKRILTWHLYKADGEVFNLRWLKRRVERFLTGSGGTGGVSSGEPPWTLAPDQTYDVSVTFGIGNQVNINLQSKRRRFLGGALFNTFALNTTQFNEFDSESLDFPVSPLAPIFKAAVDSGVLELPFQFHFVVNVSE